MVRASASQSVDLGFIPLAESYQKTLKMVSIPYKKNPDRIDVYPGKM